MRIEQEGKGDSSRADLSIIETHEAESPFDLMGNSVQGLAESGHAGQLFILERLRSSCSAESAAIVRDDDGLVIQCIDGHISASLRGILLQTSHTSRKNNGRLVTHYACGFRIFCTSINGHDESLVVLVPGDQLSQAHGSRTGYRVEVAASYLSRCLDLSEELRLEKLKEKRRRELDFLAIQAASNMEVAYSQLADGLMHALNCPFVAIMDTPMQPHNPHKLRGFSIQCQLKTRLFEDQVARKDGLFQLNPSLLSMLSAACNESAIQGHSLVVSQQEQEDSSSAHRSIAREMLVPYLVSYPLRAGTEVYGYALWGEEELDAAEKNQVQFENFAPKIISTMKLFQKSEPGVWEKLKDCWRSFLM